MSNAMASFIVAPALAWVVVSDLLYRRIGNRLVLALFLLALVHAGWLVLQGAAGSGAALATGLLAGALALVAGYAFFIMQWVGAGDAKLVAVLCLWLGDQAFAFLIVTSLAGGVLALGLPLLDLIEKTLALAVMRVRAQRPQWNIPVPQALRGEPAEGIPYGLAIAAGAAFVLWTGGA